jgi:hypothetical protein
MRFLIRALEIAILSVLSLACQQPTATPPPASHAVTPSASPVAQPHEAKELRLKAAYPGLQTLSEALPEGSFTIDAQDAATRGTLLLASVGSYDLERVTDGYIILSFFAADDYDRPLYFVQLQCSDEQANALRKRPSRLALSVIFRLTAASAASEDNGSRVLRGTLVAFSPF